MHPGTHIGGSAWRHESPTTLDLPARDRRELYGGRVVQKVTIAVLRSTDRIADDEFMDAVDALQHLLDDHFEPAWGIGAKLEAYTFDRSSSASAPDLPDAWALLLHGRDLGRELGYHSVAPTGLPLGRVLVEDPRTGDKLEDWVRLAIRSTASPCSSTAIRSPPGCMSGRCATPAANGPSTSVDSRCRTSSIPPGFSLGRRLAISDSTRPTTGTDWSRSSSRSTGSSASTTPPSGRGGG